MNAPRPRLTLVSDAPPGLARRPVAADIEAMTDPITREEMTSRLEAAEARAEAKFADLRGDVRLIVAKLDQLSGDLKASREDNMATRNQVVGMQVEMRRESQAVRTEVTHAADRALSDNRSTRNAVIGAIAGAALAVVGIGYAMQQTLLTAFQAGLSVKAGDATSKPKE